MWKILWWRNNPPPEKRLGYETCLQTTQNQGAEVFTVSETEEEENKCQNKNK
jgi:hypothetical protein